jgi:hypothetical protein
VALGTNDEMTTDQQMMRNKDKLIMEKDTHAYDSITSDIHNDEGNE